MTLAFERCCVTKMRFTYNGFVWELNDFISERITFNALRIKLTFIVALLYSLLFARVSGRFDALSAS